MILSLKLLQQKSTERNMPLYRVFIDFTKTFDTVNRSALWTVFRKHGCSEKLINLSNDVHKNMEARHSLNSELSNIFVCANGVKQWCSLHLHCSLYSWLSCWHMHATTANKGHCYIANLIQTCLCQTIQGAMPDKQVFLPKYAFIKITNQVVNSMSH